MTIDAGFESAAESARQQSLATAAARNLATTTKTPPQMRGISSRWLLRMLPWIEVPGGTYRVNRRLTHAVGAGRVAFSQAGTDVRVVPPTLTELPPLRTVRDEALLAALAGRFVRRDVRPGETLAERGEPVDQLVLIAHGKIDRTGAGQYGRLAALDVLADGDFFGEQVLTHPDAVWQYTATAQTACTVLTLRRSALAAVADPAGLLEAGLRAHRDAAARAQDRHGQAEIALAAGHAAEARLPGSFVDYELAPREYELSVVQAVIKVSSRVADLFNDPMNQVEQQVRLTVHALRERQESELVNNPDFGLLHNAEYAQRINTRSGPPTPDDMDELLSMRRSTTMFLAHPKAIAAFFRECNKRGLAVNSVEIQGHRVPAWRGVPLFPCGKIPVSAGHTSSILALRTGEEDQGVIGLRQTGIPDEYEPGLSIRFMGIDDQAITSYLAGAYHSVAILVPDAIGILENADVAASRT